MTAPPDRRAAVAAVADRLEVLFEDDHLAVVAKPAGLIVHRGWGRDPVALLNAARERLGRFLYPVHRLDRGTSGAVAFAFSAEVARALQEALQDGRIEKRYLALVRHVPAQISGVVETPIARGGGRPPLPARTRWARIAPLRASALVVALPETGRLHQVRRHLRDAGHPVIGDKEHGGGYHSRWLSELIGLERMALHALALALPHPVTGAPLQVVAPVPEDLAAPLARLGADVPGAVAAALVARAEPGGG